MTTIATARPAIQRPEAEYLVDDGQLAAAAFLARYSGRTLDAYRHDLRGFFQWAADNAIPVLDATRPHIELYRAWMEQRGLAASTINRRLSTVCGFYRFAHIDGRIGSNPVRGRKSGLERSTPLAVMELGGRRWLVASYGVVEWVRNVRAADEVTLMRGGRAETVHPTEVGPTEAVPVLREYLRRIRVARPYFDATLDSPDDDFAVEASRHPVFRLDSPPESHAV